MTIEFKAGVVQYDVKKGGRDTNVKTALAHLEKLAAEGTGLAVLPELCTTSFDNENLAEHAKYTDDTIEIFAGFAQKSRMAIAGTFPEKEAGRIYNTMVFIDQDGRIKGKYRKAHLFRLTDEHLYYTAGDRWIVVDTQIGQVGLMTCYDLRFPEMARILYLNGAQLIVVSAQWPSPRKDQWQTLIQARAVENQLFMICSNRTGTEDDLTFPGMSMIVDPYGKIQAGAGKDSGMAAADIQLSRVDEFRKLIPCRTDRRPDIYG